MKKRLNLLAIAFLAFSLLSNSAFPAWIAKVGDQEYPPSDFKDYLEFLKAQGAGELVKAALRDVEDLNLLLQQFIDRKVLLYVANKAGYNKGKEAIAKMWEQLKEPQLQQFFYLWQIQKDFQVPQVRDEDLKAFYTAEARGQMKPWEALADNEKGQVQQFFVQQRMRKDYMDRLEKKYKVTRAAKLDDFYVATVEGSKIKVSDVEDKVSQQLAASGVTRDALAKQNPTGLEKARREMREQEILRLMINLEMASQKFASSSMGRVAEALLWEGFIVERFIDNEFKSKITVSDKERDEEYNRLKDQFKGQPYDTVRSTLDQLIRERKSQPRLQAFIAERKEEIPVRRNRDELARVP